MCKTNANANANANDIDAILARRVFAGKPVVSTCPEAGEADPVSDKCPLEHPAKYESVPLVLINPIVERRSEIHYRDLAASPMSECG